MLKINLFFILSFSGNLFGALMPKGEFEYITNNHEVKIQIKDNGEWITHRKVKIKVIKESGVKKLSSRVFTYNEVIEKIDIVKISVTNGKQTSVISPSDISKDYIIPRQYGFDGMKSVKMFLPGVKVGSVLDFEYSEVKKELTQLDHFSEIFYFGINSYEENKSIEIISEKEVYYEVNDPWRTLLINSRKEDSGKFVLSIKLKRPFGHLDGDQVDNIPLSQLSFVAVSTDREWGKIVRETRSIYEKIISAPLPLTLKKISEQALKKIELPEKINFIFSKIVENYNYIAGWRTVKGRLAPRGLIDIEKTKVGDSKDIASALVAIFRKSKIDAHVALVQQKILKTNRVDYKMKLALNKWNHALVYINHQGKEYWLDPSRRSSGGIFIADNIASSDVLVLKEGSTQLHKIPDVSAKDHVIKIRQKYDFKDIDKASVRGTMSLSGRFHALFGEPKKRYRKAFIEKFVMTLLGSKEKKDFPFVSIKRPKDFSSKELDFPFKYTANKATRKKEGYFLFELPDISVFLRFKSKIADIKKKLTDFYIAPLFSLDREIVFSNISFIGNRELSCYIDSKWLFLSRNMNRLKRSIIYREKFVLKKSLVAVSDLKGVEFRVLIDQIDKCSQKSVLSLSMKKEPEKKSQIAIGKLFEGLFLKQRVFERKRVVSEVLSQRKVNRVKEYSLSDAYELMKVNNREQSSDEESHILLASILMKMGRAREGKELDLKKFTEAKYVIDLALEELGKTPKLLLNEAQLVFIIEKDKEKSLEILKKAIEKSKNRDGLFLELLADTYKIFQDDDGFLRVMNEAIKKTERKQALIDYHLKLGRHYFERDLWEECIDYYTLYINKVKNDYQAHAHIGQCYAKSRKFDQAISSYKKSLSLKRSHVIEKKLAYSYISKAQILIFEKQFFKAKSILHRAIAIFPNSDVHYKLALINLIQGDSKTALSDIDKFIEMDKNADSTGVILSEIMELYGNIDRGQSLIMAKKILEEVTNWEKKFFIATFVIKALYYEDRQEILKIFNLVQSLENLHQSFIQKNNRAKIYLASAYFFASITKDDVMLFEQSLSLLQSVEKTQKTQGMINFLKENMERVNQNLGREPTSIYWKAKKWFHLFLKENFQYRLLSLGDIPL